MRRIINRIAASTLIGFGVILAAHGINAQSCQMDATITTSGVNIPAKINPAKEYPVRVTVENSGTCTWDPSSKIRLSINIVRSPSGSPTQRDELTPVVELKYKIEPGKSHTFYYDIEGPYYLGRYTLEWIMTWDNKRFGNAVEKEIEVVPPNK